MTNTPSLRSLLDFAVDAAWQAGRITLGYFQAGVAVERKQDKSPVTMADREAERKLRALIEQSWPEHGIIGEEFGRQSGGARFTWIIDPIDGTKSFVAGVPIYGNLIALTDGETPIIGVANFPALNEMIYAVRGEGCYFNGRRCYTSKVDQMEEAVFLSSELRPPTAPDKAAAWGRLAEASYIQRTWGDSYGYALVATGRGEIMVDAYMEVWDCGPFGVILEEAGGTFTDWQGQPTIYAGEAIATNGVLFDPVMKLVRG